MPGDLVDDNLNEILSLLTPEGIATELKVTFPSVIVTVPSTAFVVTCKLLLLVAENESDGTSQEILAFNVPKLLGKEDVVLIHIWVEELSSVLYVPKVYIEEDIKAFVVRFVILTLHSPDSG